MVEELFGEDGNVEDADLGRRHQRNKKLGQFRCHLVESNFDINVQLFHLVVGRGVAAVAVDFTPITVGLLLLLLLVMLLMLLVLLLMLLMLLMMLLLLLLLLLMAVLLHVQLWIVRLDLLDVLLRWRCLDGLLFEGYWVVPGFDFSLN